MKKMFGKHSTTALACAVLSSLTLPLLGYAETPNSTGETYRVIVDENPALEEAKLEPQKMTIITAKDIEEKQAKTVEDIIFNETGVSRTVDAMGRVGVSIRGAEPRHTLILVDGQPALGEFAKYMGAADEVGRIGTENVDHIEIIQGAASAKYGADAIGGVVNVITKKATDSPQLQFNLEGKQTAPAIKSVQTVPYRNFYLRADSGKIGNLKVGIYGSQRQKLPIIASRERKEVPASVAKDLSGFPENSLRYYGNESTVGLLGTYDFSPSQKLEFRINHFNENLHRFVKYSTAEMEPMVQFKRKANRDTYDVSYSGSNDKTDWRLEGSYTRMKEHDISLASDYATNTYEGKNTLNSLDDIDHRQLSVKATINQQAGDNHLLTIGLGYSKEDGSGSRLKSAPTIYTKAIDPWDYDKALYVAPENNDEFSGKKRAKKVNSRVHAYTFHNNEKGIPYWDWIYETTGYNPSNSSTKKTSLNL